MVDLFSRHDNSTFKTQLTEGMLCSILVTDPLPRTTVSLLRRLISALLLIVAVAQLLMLFTEPFVCQLRASGIRAWMLRFPWHRSTFFPIEKTATVFCSATALSSFAFASLTLSRWLACPPSAKLCAGINDSGSPYAQQGTDAHALCEHKVEKLLGRNLDSEISSFPRSDDKASV